MKVYLVDGENVGLKWLEIAKQSEEEDLFYIFASLNAQPLHYSHLNEILEMGHKLRFFECFTGQNALDFQLSSYLGFLINSNQNRIDVEYVILSSDKGFDPVCNFWKKLNFKIRREEANKIKERTSLHRSSEIVTIKQLSDYVESAEKSERKEDVMNSILKNIFGPTEANDIIKIIDNHNASLNGIFNDLVKRFGEKRGKKIYMQTRPIIKKYKKVC